ncbi:MAG: hypothetical protein ACFFA7_12090 [Promethearchaeota archaeon]
MSPIWGTVGTSVRKSAIHDFKVYLRVHDQHTEKVTSSVYD